jgi:nicotinamide mononucleotide transporter
MVDIPPSTPSVKLSTMEVFTMGLVSTAMLLATWLRWWSISWTEVLGFITGGICVWLAVREHVWTWPIGLANNLVFFVLFWQGRLFADAGLQIVYLLIGIYGWWNWLFGSVRRSSLSISHAPRSEWILLVMMVPIATWILRAVLIAVQGAAPFWDATTTVLSLAAQYWMCRKRLEHWLIWIVADLIYVPLYFARELPLTAALYCIFLLMCLAGWREWRLRWKERQDDGWHQDVSPSGGDRQVLSAASRSQIADR